MKWIRRYILSEFGGKVVTREEIEEVCERFRANPLHTINYMIHYGYFIRILRGLYYVKSTDEFFLKRAVDPYKVISLGMEKLKLNWYFGYYTALMLNGLTHEFFFITFVLNDKISRPKEITIDGEKVRFVKLKSSLFGFGIVERDGIKVSDMEKTILDFIYLYRYKGLPESHIVAMVEEIKENASKFRRKKLEEYLKFYPKTVSEVVRNAKLL